jgi:hypothetical protein
VCRFKISCSTLIYHSKYLAEYEYVVSKSIVEQEIVASKSLPENDYFSNLL